MRSAWPSIRRLATLLICLAIPMRASAQASPAPPTSKTAPAPAEPKWTGAVSLATYVFPDEDNLLQPTVSVDHRALHLETRYNYEDTDSTSAFVGWNLEFGSTVKLTWTPMAGFVAGRTDGGIAASKLDLTWSRLEAYAEGEYVVPGDGKNRFLYNWSEFNVWATDWLRAGLATQRTRTFRRFRTEKELEPALFVGLAGSRLEGTFYVFNPGSDDKYFVVSISVTF